MIPRTVVRSAALIPFTALIIQAHTGTALEPHDLWESWSFDPGIVLTVGIAALLYGLGARFRRGVSRIQLLCFWAGWLFLTLSLISPLHPLGEVLFAAHMAQHEVLMLIAAPLLALSRPLTPMLWGLPAASRRPIGRFSKSMQPFWTFLTRPVHAFLIHAVALWAWHIPGLFQATLRSDWIHAAQHASFFGSALLFWWSLFYAHGRSGFGAALLYVFGTAVHTSILGALLTFSTTLWYPAYAATTRAWGLTPLEDQQLGGLIMWVPAGLVYIAVGIGLLVEIVKERDTARITFTGSVRDYAG